MTDSEANQLTIVLVARDHVDVVGGALASLLAQEGGAYRILVVDDGSTDGTWERIRQVLEDAPAHPHHVDTVRYPDALGPRRLLSVLEGLDSALAVIASPEETSRPDRMARILSVFETTDAVVVASNRNRIGGAVHEHAGGARSRSGPVDAREIAFHLGSTPTELGTLGLRTEVVTAFPPPSDPRLGEDLGPLLGFRGALLGSTWYLDEVLVDYRPARESSTLDVRSRETCREGLFAGLIASRTGMLNDLRDHRQGEEGSDRADVVHLEAALKGVLVELVERWTQARDELWARELRPCWVGRSELESANQRAERLRPRSLLGRVREALVRQRPAA